MSVRYWAAAKAAAGVASEPFATDRALTLGEVIDRAVAAHPGSRLAEVLRACSALVNDLPVSSSDPGAVVVPLGSTVEFLPPFAGG